MCQCSANYILDPNGNCIPFCDPPCANGGVCTAGRAGTTFCACTDLFLPGPDGNCSESICNDGAGCHSNETCQLCGFDDIIAPVCIVNPSCNCTCPNCDGTCIGEACSSNYTCPCRSFFFGDECAECSLICPTNAHCVAIGQPGVADCVCDVGFYVASGTNETLVCLVICQNGGVFNATDGTCECVAGFSGANCTCPVCVNGFCSGASGVCICNDPATEAGPTCNVTCPDCSPGTCEGDGTCLCPLGYLPSPTGCDPVCEFPCLNGGVCVNACSDCEFECSSNLCDCFTEETGWSGFQCEFSLCTGDTLGCLIGTTCELCITFDGVTCEPCDPLDDCLDESTFECVPLLPPPAPNSTNITGVCWSPPFHPTCRSDVVLAEVPLPETDQIDALKFAVWEAAVEIAGFANVTFALNTNGGYQLNLYDFPCVTFTPAIEVALRTFHWTAFTITFADVCCIECTSAACGDRVDGASVLLALCVDPLSEARLTNLSLALQAHLTACGIAIPAYQVLQPPYHISVATVNPLSVAKVLLGIDALLAAANVSFVNVTELVDSFFLGEVVIGAADCESCGAEQAASANSVVGASVGGSLGGLAGVLAIFALCLPTNRRKIATSCPSLSCFCGCINTCCCCCAVCKVAGRGARRGSRGGPRGTRGNRGSSAPAATPSTTSSIQIPPSFSYQP